MMKMLHFLILQIVHRIRSSIIHFMAISFEIVRMIPRMSSILNKFNPFALVVSYMGRQGFSLNAPVNITPSTILHKYLKESIRDKNKKTIILQQICIIKCEPVNFAFRLSKSS